MVKCLMNHTDRQTYREREREGERERERERERALDISETLDSGMKQNIA